MVVNISIFNLFLQADFLVKIVMTVLLGMSILSWTIILKNSRTLLRASKNVDLFEDKFWSGSDLSSLYQDVKKRKEAISGTEEIFYSGFTEFLRLRKSNSDSPNFVMENTGRAMFLTVAKAVKKLERNLPLLATVASISPYVGLLGTVWGIMHSFIALGDAKQATLMMIAPGVAEALIATAMGLFAAIPAVIAYNLFSGKVSKLEHSYSTFSEEFYSILYRLVLLRQ
ncbi:protein tolQ [Candidatus Photodesmus blepharus]|uniref:Tol-Pal system protein TolQ n=1 Tax=Candidatus Photodesmus blepharonis TaxID=1179155 RepID=A0A084CP98_9GAMM|nr:protein TolQ [Candidatus Photodesmus blepharus]KEY91627.1 protein tolQ [Candidatus Photodesmus blepharus]